MKYNCTWLVDNLPNRTEFAIYERGTDKLIHQGTVSEETVDAYETVELLKTLGVKVYSYKKYYNNRTDKLNFNGKGIMEVL